MSKKRVVLPGSRRQRAVGAETVQPANPSERTFVTVHLRRKEEPLPIAEHGVRFSPEEYRAAYGASANDFLAVRDFAQEYGLEARNESAVKRSIELHGTVADLSRAFGVDLETVAINGRNYRHREGDITIPEDLLPIVSAVLGLDNRPQARPHFRDIPEGMFRPATTAGAMTTLAVAQLYDFPKNLDGTGQIIAIIELDGGFLQSDLDVYFPSLGLATPKVIAVSVDGGKNLVNQHLPDHPELNADGEVALDIQVAGAVSPGAKQLVYFAPNTDQGFTDAILTAAICARESRICRCR